MKFPTHSDFPWDMDSFSSSNGDEILLSAPMPPQRILRRNTDPRDRWVVVPYRMATPERPRCVFRRRSARSAP